MAYPNDHHFTGKKGSKKNKPKDRTTRKSRRINKRRHKNEYKHLVEPRKVIYDHGNKTFRQLPLFGESGEVFKAGFKVLFHGRLYRLMHDTEIKFSGMLGEFELFAL